MLPAMKRFDSSDWPELAALLRRPRQSALLAMYSSLYGGIVTDPALMVLPLDDHMVHRGDGIFEAFKAVDGRIYNLNAHLDRLDMSARGLALPVPAARGALTEIIVETVRAAGRRSCMIRLFVSRGPGGFSVNPYECPQQQIYVVVTELGAPFMQMHPEGARLKTSAIAAKSASMAGIKNCNYAPNVLMKKEAIDAKVDFTVGFDEDDVMTEGSVENIGIVSRDGRLLFPTLDRILAGTTMLRAMDLARTLAGSGLLAGAQLAPIRREDIRAAREVLIAGTTINIAAGVVFDGNPVGDGRPGPVYRALSELLIEDMRSNSALLTPV